MKPACKQRVRTLSLLAQSAGPCAEITQEMHLTRKSAAVYATKNSATYTAGPNSASNT